MVLLTVVSMDNYYQPQMFDMETLKNQELKNLVKTLESTKFDNEKDIHHIVRGKSEPVTSTKKPIVRRTRCCDKVRIFSSNVAAELYPDLLGVYKVIDKEDFHPPTYKLV